MSEERWIRASEIQSYGYCARAWWLRYIQGLEPENREALDAGTERHTEQGRQVLRSTGLRQAAIALLIAGLLVAVLATIRLMGGG
jgi:hypothetical protein